MSKLDLNALNELPKGKIAFWRWQKLTPNWKNWTLKAALFRALDNLPR